MPRIDNQRFYETAIRRYGCTARGLNWNSKASQHTRFEVIYELLADELSSAKMVDAGCGFGDLYLFLKQKGALPRSYIGYDTLDEALFVAHKRTKQRFVKCDILCDALEEADYYIASGSMNILNRFETHLFIERCFEASQKGFVFNLLKGDDISEHFNYWQVEEILLHVKEFGCEVTLKEGYMEGDFTIFLKKAYVC